MLSLLKDVNLLLSSLSFKIATAESCTGGALGALFTKYPGASDIFECGFITYSNDSKTELLSVPRETILQNGAVSAETALAMARGALAKSHADIVISITGIAGPSGGTVEKPVGTVFIAYGCRNDTIHCTRHLFDGTREDVQNQTILAALSHVKDYMEKLA
jgi:nicotinamide-nucleotide amidase